MRKIQILLYSLLALLCLANRVYAQNGDCLDINYIDKADEIDNNFTINAMPNEQQVHDMIVTDLVNNVINRKGLVADTLEIGDGSASVDEFSYTSLLSYEDVITEFIVANYYDFGALKIDWSPNEAYTNIDVNYTSRLIITREDTEVPNVIEEVACMDITPGQPISLEDVGLGSGKKFIYRAQAYVLDEQDMLMAFSPVWVDTAYTMSYELVINNLDENNPGYVDSDGEIEISWNVDANCLEGDEGEPVYFSVIDETTEQEILIQEIDDPSEYLVIGTFENEHQLNFAESDYISLPTLTSPAAYDWTIEFWARPEEDEKSRFRNIDKYFFSNDQGDGLFYQYDTYESITVYYTYTDTEGTQHTIEIASNVEAGEWTHFSITSSYSSSTIYIDGIKTKDISSGQLFDFEYIGSNSTQTLYGSVAHFRIWEDKRSTEEVKYNYLYGMKGDETGLMAYYILEEGSSGISSALDQVTNTHNALISGATWMDFMIPTDDNKVFSFTDVIYADHSSTHSFSLKIFEVGSADTVCPVLTEYVSSTPINTGASVSATQGIDPSKVEISWDLGNSDWADGFYIFRRENGAPNEEWLRLDYVDATETSYIDAFDPNSENSIEIGKQYEYQVSVSNNDYGLESLTTEPVGYTFDFSLSAQEVNDTIQLSWTDLSALASEYDTIKLTLDGEDLKYITDLTRTTSFNPFPVFGENHVYGLSFLKNGKSVASVYHDIPLSNNGSIAGRITTRSDDFPLEGVTVSITGYIDNKAYNYVGTTDSMGYYFIDEIYYADRTDFRVEAILEGHSFVGASNKSYNTTSFDRVSHDWSEINFESILEYGYDMNSGLNLSNLSRQDNDTLQFVDLTWDVNLSLSGIKEEKLVYFNLYRDGEYVETLCKEASPSGTILSLVTSETFRDFTANPGSDKNYVLVSYLFKNQSEVYLDSLELNLDFADSVLNDISGLSAFSSVDTGVVKLSWQNTTAWNIDGYVISRSDEVIDTIKDAQAVSYVDLTGEPGQVYDYQINTYLKNDVELVLSLDTAEISLVSYPDLVTPVVVHSANTDEGAVYFDVRFALNIPLSDYNFDGVMLKRDFDTLALIDKEFFALNNGVHQGRLHDRSGELGSYAYEITLYKQIGDDIYTSPGATGLNNITLSAMVAPILSVNRVHSNHVVELSWYCNDNATVDSLVVLRNNIEVDVLPIGQLSYIDVAEGENGNVSYKIQPFSFVDGSRVLHTTSNTAMASLSSVNHSIIAPQEVFASYFYKQYVEVTWDFPDYFYAEFEVSRDGEILDTLAREYRSYKDYDAEEGESHSYQVRSLYNDRHSDWVSAVGEKYTFSAIHGRVMEQNASSGVHGAEVAAIWQQGGTALNWMKTETDSSGHYAFDHVPFIDNADAIVLRAIKNGCSFADANADFETVGQVQEIDIFNGVSYHMEENRNIAVSEILSVSTYANEIDGKVEIRWVPESNQYDGFYIFRNYNVILDVQVWDENFVAYDENGSTGYDYIYSVQAYYKSPTFNEEGYELSETKDAEAYTTFPGSSEILNFHAVEKLDSNQVELYWSHYGAADKFELYRSDRLIAEIGIDEKHEFIDLTGAPGNNYKYSIRAYSAKSDEYTDYESIELTYPDLVAVTNFDAVTEADNNRVHLSWDYTGKSIDGYYVYRNEIKMAELDSTIKYWTDTTGIPQTWHDYAVAAFRVDDDDDVISAFTTDTAYFPMLDAANEVLAGDVDNVIQINWEYEHTNIEGFYVRRLVNNVEEPVATISIEDSIELGKFQYTDAYGLPEVNYHYVVYAYDHRGEDLVEYLASAGTHSNVTYPAYPGVTKISTTNSNTYIKLEWSYDWGYVDGFLLTIDDSEKIDLDANKRVYYHHINGNACLNVASNRHSYVLEPYRIINEDTVISSTNIDWVNEQLISCSGLAAKITDFEATQATHRDKIRLKWKYSDLDNTQYVTLTKELDGLQVESIQLSSSFTFHEDDDIHDGYEYIYTITPNVNGSDQLSATTSGWSKMLGNIVGQVASYDGNNGIPNVDVRLKAEKDGISYNYWTKTDDDGIFNAQQLFVHKSDPITYEVTAVKENHDFLNNGQLVEITPDFYSGGIESTIYDLQSTTIFGEVTSMLGCGQDSVKVTLYQLDANLVADAGQNVVTEDGAFSFTPIPMPNVAYVSVVVSPIKDSVSQVYDYWHFTNDSVVFIWSDIEHEMTQVSFEDTTHYELEVSVKNGCGFSLGDYSFQVAVESKDGCYYGNYDTDYAGNLSIALPPDDYTVRIMDVSPLDAQSQAYIDYFRVRSDGKDLESTHEVIVSTQVAYDNPAIEFVFHKTPKIEMAKTFDQYDSRCNDLMEGLNVVTQSDPYSDISFSVFETYDGTDCEVKGGYLQIKNDAAADSDPVVLAYVADVDGDGDTINGWYVNDPTLSNLEAYEFTAGDPYPVYPYLKGMTVEYWSGTSVSSAEFMKDKTHLMFVEGQTSSGDDNDIIVRSNDYDEVNLPLFILRDPPGDKSYSYVKAGTKIKRELELEGVGNYGYGINTKESFPVGVVELRAQQIYKGNEGSGYGTKLSVELTIGEELKTQGSAQFSTNEQGYITGKNADVVVGMGIAMSYGIHERIKLVVDENNQCGIANWLNYEVSADKISTTWIYTRAQIENLIENYRDMAANDEVYQEGVRINDYIDQTADNWGEILNVLDVKSLPHYQLCHNQGWQVGDDSDSIGKFCNHFFTNGGVYGDTLTGNKWGSRQIDLYNSLTENYADEEFDELYEDLNDEGTREHYSYTTKFADLNDFDIYNVATYGMDDAGGYASDLWQMDSVWMPGSKKKNLRVT